jgi:hypothetical protein
MQRRSLLKLGMGSAVVLAIAGGAIALLQPGLQQGALSPRSRLVLSRVAEAIIADAWPGEGSLPRAAAMDALLIRINAQIAGTPDPVQAELSQLLTIMDSAAGRRALVGISSTWDAVGAAEVATALQSMRLSRISLRQQAYQGLHDLVYASYFSGKESWQVLGYPGPMDL